LQIQKSISYFFTKLPKAFVALFQKNKIVQQKLLLFFKKIKMCNKNCCSFSKYFKSATMSRPKISLHFN